MSNKHEVVALRSDLDVAFTVDEVQAAAKALRKSTASGPDAVAAACLANGSFTLHAALTDVFNFSWVHGVIPLEWKKADAFALFKKGDHSDPSSYRIISVTSTVMRLFERVVYARLSSHLDSRRFFTDSQAGFRHGLSTVDCIYKLLRDVYSTTRSRKRLPVVFLDIIKAFDRVPHDSLLYKLHTQAGVWGKAWGWLHAFLSDRKFRVCQGDHASEWYTALAGVPQGCVLSPLLFAIFINDLDEHQLAVVLSLFADDAAVWPSLRSRRQYRSQLRVLRDFCTHVDAWSAMWGLEFSKDKTQMVVFDNKMYEPPAYDALSLGAHPVLPSDSYRYLGVTFQRNARWNMHFVVAKCKLTANLIARINHRVRGPPAAITITLVNRVLIPQMSYALAFWRLTKAQERILDQVLAVPLRRALGLHRSASAIRTLWECGVPTISTVRRRAIVQSVSRAVRCSDQRNPLPSLLVRDM